jgi:protein kinase A
MDDFNGIDTLGQTENSVVELAIYVPTGKYIALKVLDKVYYEEKNMVRHAYAEKKILQQIHSPFKIKLLGSFKCEENLYLVTEYVEGETLIDMIQRYRGLSEATCKFYAAQIVLFLEAMHGAKALYRDLKPENLMVSRWDHYLKVIDFGLSTYLGPSKQSTNCGTLHYLCPEKVKGAPYDYTSDIWSFGILLYVMFTDRHLYVPQHSMAETLTEMRKFAGHSRKLLQEASKKHGKPPPSPELENLINTCLSFRAKDRPPIQDIKRHPWFRDISFDQVYAKKMPHPTTSYNRKSSKSTTKRDLWESW